MSETIRHDIIVRFKKKKSKLNETVHNTYVQTFNVSLCIEKTLKKICFNGHSDR